MIEQQLIIRPVARDVHRLRRAHLGKIRDHRDERLRRLGEGRFLRRPAAPHADIGLVMKVLPVLGDRRGSVFTPHPFRILRTPTNSALSVISTPARRISSSARAVSPGCRFTPRQASAMRCVWKPSLTASSAVAFTQ